MTVKQMGWADDRMMQVYDLIWEIQRTHAALGITSEFQALLKAVEDTDDLLCEVMDDAEQGA